MKRIGLTVAIMVLTAVTAHSQSRPAWSGFPPGKGQEIKNAVRSGDAKAEVGTLMEKSGALTKPERVALLMASKTYHHADPAIASNAASKLNADSVAASGRPDLWWVRNYGTEADLLAYITANAHDNPDAAGKAIVFACPRLQRSPSDFWPALQGKGVVNCDPYKRWFMLHAASMTPAAAHAAILAELRAVMARPASVHKDEWVRELRVQHLVLKEMGL